MSTPDERYAQALWYAWGVADSGAVPGLNTVLALRFAERQREFQVKYSNQELSTLPSLMAALGDFLVEHELPVPPPIKRT